DLVAGLHGDERQHGLAAEQVLILDAVLVDLVGLVEVAALAGRELELRDPVPEHDRDDGADAQDDDPRLAEVEAKPRPKPMHRHPLASRSRRETKPIRAGPRRAESAPRCPTQCPSCPRSRPGKRVTGATKALGGSRSADRAST